MEDANVLWQKDAMENPEYFDGILKELKFGRKENIKNEERTAVF